MIRKKFILFFLAISILLPIGIAFLSSVYQKKDNRKYLTILFSIPEEEHKEENKPFEKEKEEEKEKEFVAIRFVLCHLTSLSEKNLYLHCHLKPLNGKSELPFNPPELI